MRLAVYGRTCIRRECRIVKHADLTGNRFGKLTVIAYVGEKVMPSGQKHRVWQCRCECGVEKNVRAPHLASGHTKSCGCSRSIHGQAGNPAFLSWKAMVRRCSVPTEINWHNYGGRGIRVCDRWMDFENFLQDMGPRPVGASIERADNDGNYEPENCRWATRIEQGRNRRTNRLIEFNGVKNTLSSWEEETGIMSETIARRLALGWSIQDALTKPVRTQRNNRSAA